MQTYDARLEQAGWSTVSFGNVSQWSAVPLYPNWSPVLNVQAMPPITVMRTVQPVAVVCSCGSTYKCVYKMLW